MTLRYSNLQKETNQPSKLFNEVIDWFSYNKLSVNTSKCESMHFGCGFSKKKHYNSEQNRWYEDENLAFTLILY